MLKSMTGFGRANAITKAGELAVEIKSVNHRFFDPRIRLPRNLSAVEINLINLLKERLSRGRIEMNLNLVPTDADQLPLRVNKPLAARYKELAGQLADELGLADNITIDFLLQQPDVVVTENGTRDSEHLWEEVRGVVSQALDALDQMRRQEGEALEANIRGYIHDLQQQWQILQDCKDDVVSEFKLRFQERLAALLEGSTLETTRFDQEMALFADRCDISEELSRLESHLAQLGQELEGPSQEPSGRKIDFLLQEIFREINTIGSKANNLLVTQTVLKMKATVEKIREQIQNVE